MCTESTKLPDYATVFQAEIQAVYEACQYLLSIIAEWEIKYIKILTDSQAALLALSNTNIHSKTVLKTIDLLESLRIRSKTLTIAWIKAHIGHEGNEQAD